MSDTIAEVEVDALAQELRRGDPVVLVDVREPWEHALGTLPGVHRLPLSTLPGGLDALDAAKDAAVVTICHHGMRSVKAAHWLQRVGYSHVRSLRGGTDAWAEHIDPTLGRY